MKRVTLSTPPANTQLIKITPLVKVLNSMMDDESRV